MHVLSLSQKTFSILLFIENRENVLPRFRPKMRFHYRAMPELGLDVPKADIDELFDEWDKGGDGALGLRELQKILSTASVASKDAKGKDKSPAEKSLATAAAVSSAASAMAKLTKKNKD